MTFWDTIERGEYVMFALAVLVIVIIVIWWVRGVALNRRKKTYHSMMQRVRDHVVEGDLENARQLCEVADSPGGRVICAGIHRIGRPMSEVKGSMNEVADIEKDEMAKGSGWLRSIAVISPLLGLGGTLVGIVDRLRDLGESGANIDTSAVCGALAPTIVTTVAGIGVGIFSLFALTCLEGTINSARRRLDEVSVEFTALLDEPV